MNGCVVVSCLYENLTRESRCVNVNHVILNIEYLFGKDCELVFHYLIEYNFLFKFL